MSLRNLAVAIALLAASPAAAQDMSRSDALKTSYALWGMMDTMANFCWERSGYDPAHMEAHQNWLARNVVVRDELDQALTAGAEDPGIVAAGEEEGSAGIRDIMVRAENPDEACLTWLTVTQSAVELEAEYFLQVQLGLLRERDGL